MPVTTTFQIANAKEQFLETSLRLIAPVMDASRDDDVVSLLEDVESLARDAIGLLATLLRCDEQHHLLAVTSEDYPYVAAENRLDRLFRRFLTMCDELHALAKTFQSQGHEIRSLPALEAVCSHARRLVYDDDTFYETETYRTIAQRALVEYESGQVETWPV